MAGADPISNIASLLQAGINKIWPDKNVTIEQATQIAQSVHTEILAQIEVNKVEAQHASIFVAGWRPFIGWVCGISLATYYIPRTVLSAALWTWSCLKTGALVPYPDMPLGDLLSLLGGMLGLGIIRQIGKNSGEK